MCGIAGILSTASSAQAIAQVKAAAAMLLHRGPEGSGFWQNATQTVTFGHQRLCIIDLRKEAAQPMRYADRYTIVYNGEMYNYLEVKNDLQARGFTFTTDSDTEVILAAYAAWGDSCLQYFDGAFAFAIWDEKEEVLFAARDRFGEKPFFFFYDEQQLLFASEIKALWAMGVAKEINSYLLYNFLTIGYTTNPADPQESFFKSIHKLPAAHQLNYSFLTKELQIQRYWQVDIRVDEKIKEAEAIEKFTLLLTDSIKKRLRSDVAIGTSLSGGLDSSAIAAFCAGEKDTNYTYKTFTASFKGFEKDELKHASLVAKDLGLEHFITTVDAKDVVRLMDVIGHQQDEPFSSASLLAQYKVFELAKEQGVTVLLDGQGADETIGGYYKYYRWYWQELYRAGKLASSGELNLSRELGVEEKFSVKHKIAALFPDFATSLLQPQKSRKAFQHPDLNREFAFANKQSLYYATPTTFDLNGALYFNTFVHGLEELLRFADRNSMAHSVEVRLPFLQHQLVEFLFTLPPQFKIGKGWTKWLLRKAVHNKLPAEIVWRKDKVGYEPPQKQWMQNKDVQERIQASKKTLVQQGILHASVLNKRIVPKDVHDANSYDWRYWSAAALFA